MRCTRKWRAWKISLDFYTIKSCRSKTWVVREEVCFRLDLAAGCYARRMKSLTLLREPLSQDGGERTHFALRKILRFEYSQMVEGILSFDQLYYSLERLLQILNNRGPKPE
jgi:hypothetical protein